MIYLIGGPPKCGKTTFSKLFARVHEIPYVSSDSLQSIIKPYVNDDEVQKGFPASQIRGENNDDKYTKYFAQEIITAYIQQARYVADGIKNFIACEVADHKDIIIEGYHITPQLVSELQKLYPNQVKALFIVKTNVEKFVEDIPKSSTKNDWIIERTNDESTYIRIAQMICDYGKWFQDESEKYNLKCFSVDEDFEGKLEEMRKYLIEKL